MRSADIASPTETQRLQPTQDKHFRADIEGFRGFTLLAIFGYHAHVPGMGGGFIGPDIFFIISGFVITAALWRELSNTGTLGLRRFFGSRARRLLPVAAAVAAVTMVVSVFLLSPLQARPAVGDGIASSLYVGNMWFIARGVDYFASHVPASPFEHYWTLGVEEQFYLIWPALIVGTAWFVRRARRRNGTEGSPLSKRPFIVVLTVITVVSFLMGLLATYTVPAAAYFSLPTRAWDFSAGALLALTAASWQKLSPRAAVILGWAGLTLLFVTIYQLPSNTPYPGFAALLPLLGSVLVIGAGCAIPSSQGCGRFLGSSAMRFLGRLSYSWYLWHWPVLIFAPIIVGHPLGLAGRLTALLFSGVLAWFTLRYLENPLRYSKSLRRSPMRSLAVGGVATALAVCVGLVMMGRIPAPAGHGPAAPPMTLTAATPVPGATIADDDAAVRKLFAQVQDAVKASAGLTAVPSNLTPALEENEAGLKTLAFGGCFRTPFETGQPDCVMGDADSDTTIALIGDSHSAMMIPAFRAAAEQRGWRFTPMGKGACSVIAAPVSGIVQQLLEKVNHCQAWRSEILARIHAEQPQLVVVSLWRGYGTNESLSGLQAYDQNWLDGMTSLVQDLRGAGAKVLVLGPIPDPHIPVPLCLSGSPDDMAPCTPKRATSVNEPGIVAESAAAAAGGAHYADLTDLFCATEICPAVIGNTLTYMDQSHITLQYSSELAPVMGALADRALAGD